MTTLTPAQIDALAVKWGHILNKTYRPGFEPHVEDLSVARQIIRDVLSAVADVEAPEVEEVFGVRFEVEVLDDENWVALPAFGSMEKADALTGAEVLDGRPFQSRVVEVTTACTVTRDTIWLGKG